MRNCLRRSPRSFALLSVLAVGLAPPGCGKEEVPVTDAQSFEEGKQERMEIIQKEYGPAAASGKARPGR